MTTKAQHGNEKHAAQDGSKWEVNGELFRLLIHHMPAAVAILDREMRFMFVSDRWLAEYGITGRSIVGLSYYEVFPDTCADCKAMHRRCLTGVSARCNEERVVRPDDAIAWVRWEIQPWCDPNGAVGGIIIFTEFITERKLAEEQLRHASLHDYLTGLSNRALLMQNLHRSINRARRGSGSTLLFLDLDKFKAVNDTLGHSIGDQALIEVGELLAQHTRGADTLARVGGDEFAVLLDEATLPQAQNVAERMLKAISNFRFVREGCSFSFGLSIGIVPIYGHQEADVLLTLADMAMYAAKQQGGNCIVARNIGG